MTRVVPSLGTRLHAGLLIRLTYPSSSELIAHEHTVGNS